MSFQQQNQPQTNWQPQQVPGKFNHGGHEVFDVHEVLSTTIGALNVYTLLRQFVKDPELTDIMNRQYQFIQDEYNITLECFQTGRDPSKPTQSYMMKQNNDFVYGMKQQQPKKPVQSANEINDAVVSGLLLGQLKAIATGKTFAALETTNPVVRRVLQDSIPNDIEMAYELSLYQNKHGYYQVPQLTQQDMTMMVNAYAKAQGQSPYAH